MSISSEKRSIRFHPFARLRATLEDDFVAARSSDNAKRLGHVIVFLDDRRTEFALMEVFAGSEDRLLEIGMLKQSQG